MSWRLQQTAARTAATCQLQSSLPLPPSVDEIGVRLRLSGTRLDDDEQAAHDAQVAGRLLGTTETAERPGVSARTVERLVAAGRRFVQPAMARGYQGQARDVPDDAFQRRTTAIGRPVAAAEAPRPAASRWPPAHIASISPDHLVRQPVTFQPEHLR